VLFETLMKKRDEFCRHCIKNDEVVSGGVTYIYIVIREVVLSQFLCFFFFFFFFDISK
jgi:hypothetical protein